MKKNQGDPLAPTPIAAPESSIPPISLIPTPFQDKVIVLVDEAAVMVGSLILADASKSPPLSGKVLACGIGVHDRATAKLIPMEVIEGDHVTFSRFAGEDFQIEGKPAKVMREADLNFRMPRAGEPNYDVWQQMQQKQQEIRDRINNSGAAKMPHAGTPLTNNLEVVSS